MTYEQALNLIHSRPKLPSRDSLIRMAPALEALGHPERKLSFIHITGTNGKGSTAAMTAAVLQAAGYRTGLFLSPFILDFRERMQINRQMISQQALTTLVEELLPLIQQLDAEGRPISEFELDTLLALCWFAREQADMVVLEVGIGGRHDATNVIPPPHLSLIMGIGLDHVKTLGDSIEAIAYEKSGIIKGNPAVSYPFQPPEALAVLMERCAETGSTLTLPNPNAIEIRGEALSGSQFCYRDQAYHLPLIGRHQIYNAITAIEGLLLLGIPQETIAAGLANVSFPARLELMQQEPPILIDGAHNPHGMAALCDSISRLADRPITAIVGMLDTKDAADTLSLLSGVCQSIISVPINNPHSNRPDKLAELLRAQGFSAVTVHDCDVPDEAFYRRVLADARAQNPDGLLLCCGSLYLASDLRKLFFQSPSDC